MYIYMCVCVYPMPKNVCACLCMYLCVRMHTCLCILCFYLYITFYFCENSCVVITISLVTWKTCSAFTWLINMQPKTGWFSEYLVNTLRLRVKVRFLSICPKEGAEVLLRSTYEKFERSKKLETLSRIRKPVAEHQHLNQGIKA